VDFLIDPLFTPNCCNLNHWTGGDSPVLVCREMPVHVYSREKNNSFSGNKTLIRCIYPFMSLISQICARSGLRKEIAASRVRLYRVALAWCGDRMLADDLVQEALSLGLQKAHQLRDRDRLNAWLYSILNNCWKQHLRSYRPHEDLDDDRPSNDLEPDSAAGQMEIVTRVRCAVAGLPLEQRKVLALVDLEGFAYSDVANILEIPIGTVMSRLYRARKSLIGLLENDSPEAEGQVRQVTSIRRVK
jgi:RNA polymerase sigma-70 factor, ECF subfamily